MIQKRIVKISCLLVLLGTSPKLYAQHFFKPLSHEWLFLYPDTSWAQLPHSHMRNYRSEEVDFIDNERPAPEQNFFVRKLFHENIVEIKGEDYHFTANPLMSIRAGQGSADRGDLLFQNTRGYIIQGRIGKQVSFLTTFTENQVRFPQYFRELTTSTGVVPRGGRYRSFKGSDEMFDYANATGEIAFQPSKYFTFAFGQGQHFFGDGYRSMIMSDAAFSYPFFRIETNVWKFRYTNLWTEWRDLRSSVISGRQFRKKFAAIHMLSYQATKRFNISIFEAVLYPSDSNNRGLEWGFFNPVILYRPVEFAHMSRDGNMLLGASASYQLFNNTKLYGQFVLDEFVLGEIVGEPGSWRNKYSWQLGVNTFAPFGVKGLFARAEFNAVRPYIYSHSEVLTNYAHYGQPIAHNYGANLREVVLQGTYNYRRFTISGSMGYSWQGIDANEDENYGGDLYKPYGSRVMQDEYFIGDGNLQTLLFTEGRIGWMMNPAYNLLIEATAQYRYVQNENPALVGNFPRQLMFFVGLRTALFNQYFDY